MKSATDCVTTRHHLALCPIDPINLDETISAVRGMVADARFHYLVTPNMDHLQRLYCDDTSGVLKDIYRRASLSLCDSRILEKLLRLRGLSIPEVIPGSSLTAELFERELHSEDRIVLVGGSDTVVEKLRLRFPRLQFSHINPSMGFIHQADEVKQLCDRIAETRADFIFLAVGSPQQELLAAHLSERLSRGVALCVGASLLFLSGDERRAPSWLQYLHGEWLYRLLQNPRRLIRRYFSNAIYLPRIFFALGGRVSGGADGVELRHD